MSDDVAADVRVLALSLGGIVVTALIVFAVLSLNCVREAEEDKSCCGLGGLSSAILGTCNVIFGGPASRPGRPTKQLLFCSFVDCFNNQPNICCSNPCVGP